MYHWPVKISTSLKKIYKALTDTMGRHFSQVEHHGISDMVIYIMQFIKLPPQSQRALHLHGKVEIHWIHKFKCPAPLGLNILHLVNITCTVMCSTLFHHIHPNTPPGRAFCINYLLMSVWSKRIVFSSTP